MLRLMRCGEERVVCGAPRALRAAVVSGVKYDVDPPAIDCPRKRSSEPRPPRQANNLPALPCHALANNPRLTTQVFLFSRSGSQKRFIYPTYSQKIAVIFHNRSYHDENTASRPICEVKHHRAQSVLGWGTTWEA